MRAKLIKDLVKIVEESSIGELEITRWWFGKIRISKSTTHVASITSQVDTSPVHVARPQVAPQEVQVAAQVIAEQLNSKHVEVKSPMVGTFYRAPSPDSEPYAKEGDIISPGKVLCIIEAMKLMNEIEAEISGKIVKILVENGQPVEFNQPMFLVEKA